MNNKNIILLSSPSIYLFFACKAQPTNSTPWYWPLLKEITRESITLQISKNNVLNVLFSSLFHKAAQIKKSYKHPLFTTVKKKTRVLITHPSAAQRILKGIHLKKKYSCFPHFSQIVSPLRHYQCWTEIYQEFNFE